MDKKTVAFLIDREKEKKYLSLVENIFFDRRHKFGIRFFACLLEDEIIESKEQIYASIIIQFLFFVRKYFYPRKEDKTKQIYRIEKMQIIFRRIFSKDIFDIERRDETKCIRNICRRKKSIAIEIGSSRVAIVGINVFSFDMGLSKSYFKFKGIHGNIEEIEFIIFYNFSIDDGKEVLSRNEGNKHACRID